MTKFIVALLGLSLTVFRFYLIYKILYWLFVNYGVDEPNFSDIKWFLCAVFLDLYVSSLEKSYEVDIYKEKKDDKELN
jgi:hypothetical protein